MPKYSYRCKSCQAITEVNQSFDDAPLTHCLKSNGEANRIITSDISIQFRHWVLLQRYLQKNKNRTFK